jgi:intracellular sulfur oxidation DsrE/DsrF family protein
MRSHSWVRAFPALVLTAVLTAAPGADEGATDDPDYPEASEIDALLTAETPPSGVLFNVLEYDEDGLEWLAPRIDHYIRQLRRRYPQLPIAAVSHGDEMFALRDSERWLYADVHRLIQRLVEEQEVTFHVCGAYAAANGVDEGEFPQYIDVVPLATTQMQDYRELGFTVISTELSW